VLGQSTATGGSRSQQSGVLAAKNAVKHVDHPHIVRVERKAKPKEDADLRGRAASRPRNDLRDKLRTEGEKMKKQLFTSTICLLALFAATPGWGQKLAYNLPPSQRLMEPGPGVGGPGPGVLMPASAMGGMGAGGGAGFAAMGGMCPSGMGGPGMLGPHMGGIPGAGATSQIAFLGIEGGEVTWDVTGHQMFDSAPLIMPGRQNFPQGAIYRLKLTNLPGRPGVELYPTLEVGTVTPRTDAYLAHAPIPLQFTDEDLDQVLSGNFVTKVIYLPSPEFQELALAGVETLVSTRLDPGVDPITEASRRGSILAIVRIGNLDLQARPPGFSMTEGVQHAQYADDDCEIGPTHGGVYHSGPGGYHGVPSEGYLPGGYGNVPQGMPTSAFAPQPMPPHLVSGMTTPQWGMPHVGTPIGLPGPPHIPLGHEAGLTKHVMHNHTRTHMPPPVNKMKMDVKQRPGMNYPRPVNRVHVSEVNRAGFRPVHGTVPGPAASLFHRLADRLKGVHGEEYYGEDECYEGMEIHH